MGAQRLRPPQSGWQVGATACESCSWALEYSGQEIKGASGIQIEKCRTYKSGISIRRRRLKEGVGLVYPLNPKKANESTGLAKSGHDAGRSTDGADQY